MRAEFITPFLGALSRTMSSALGCEVHAGALSTQCEKFHEVSAIVGISGKAVGMMILSLSENLATHIAAKMLMVETDGFNIDAVDAVASWPRRSPWGLGRNWPIMNCRRRWPVLSPAGIIACSFRRT